MKIVMDIAAKISERLSAKMADDNLMTTTEWNSVATDLANSWDKGGSVGLDHFLDLAVQTPKWIFGEKMLGTLDNLVRFGVDPAKIAALKVRHQQAAGVFEKLKAKTVDDGKLSTQDWNGLAPEIAANFNQGGLAGLVWYLKAVSEKDGADQLVDGGVKMIWRSKLADKYVHRNLLAPITLNDTYVLGLVDQVIKEAETSEFVAKMLPSFGGKGYDEAIQKLKRAQALLKKARTQPSSQATQQAMDKRLASLQTKIPKLEFARDESDIAVKLELAKKAEAAEDKDAALALYREALALLEKWIGQGHRGLGGQRGVVEKRIKQLTPAAPAPDAALATAAATEAADLARAVTPATEVAQLMRSAGIKACYERVLKTNPNLGGRITFSLDITPVGNAGKATKIEVVPGESSLRDQGMEECMINAIRRNTFTPPSETMTLQATGIFQPAAQ